MHDAGAVRVDDDLPERVVVIRDRLHVHRQIADELEDRGEVGRMDPILRLLHADEACKRLVFQEDTQREEPQSAFRESPCWQPQTSSLVEEEREDLADLVELHLETVHPDAREV